MSGILRLRSWLSKLERQAVLKADVSPYGG
jgi:hypothetical protein